MQALCALLQGKVRYISPLVSYDDGTICPMSPIGYVVYHTEPTALRTSIAHRWTAQTGNLNLQQAGNILGRKGRECYLVYVCLPWLTTLLYSVQLALAGLDGSMGVKGAERIIEKSGE
jgi:hypothetical protein